MHTAVEGEKAPAEQSTDRVRFWIAVWALSLVLICTFGAMRREIQGYLPYPRHMDEAFLTQRALNILKTNDWNPHHFNYSSFPVYLVTAALAMGYLDYAAEQEAPSSLDAIKSVAYPHYDPKSVVAPARYLFALFLLAALALLGLYGYWHLKAPAMLPLVPLIGYLSPFIQYESTNYINVDVLAVCMTALVLVSALYATGSGRFLLTALVPGLLCGLAAAAKYTYCWALIPALLGIWLFDGKWKAYRSLVLILSAAIAFLAVVPWAILDIRAFVDSLGAEAWAYATGRPEQTYDPGWNHASQYLTGLARNFGLGTLILAALGTLYAAKTNLRFTLILFSFPLLNLVHLSSNSLFYDRNALFLYPLCAYLAATGLIAAFKILEKAVSRITALQNRPLAHRFCSTAAMLLITLLFLPCGKHICFANRPPEARNLVTKWIQRNVPKSACIITPNELGLDTAPLKDKYLILERDYNDYSQSSFLSQAQKYGAVYALTPTWAVGDGKDKAERKNALAQLGCPLFNHPGNAIGAFMAYPVTHGDPDFSLNLILPNAPKFDESALRAMNALSMYDIFQASQALKKRLPPDFRSALDQAFAQNAFPSRPVSPELDFVDMDIRRIGGNTFDFRFMFFVKKAIPKDWRFYLCLNNTEEQAGSPPKKESVRPRRWNSSPQPPTSQWQPGKFIVISLQKTAVSAPYNVSLGFCHEDNTPCGAEIPLGITDFAKR